jgi:hypothetical protein
LVVHQTSFHLEQGRLSVPPVFFPHIGSGQKYSFSPESCLWSNKFSQGRTRHASNIMVKGAIVWVTLKVNIQFPERGMGETQCLFGEPF